MTFSIRNDKTLRVARPTAAAVRRSLAGRKNAHNPLSQDLGLVRERFASTGDIGVSFQQSSGFRTFLAGGVLFRTKFDRGTLPAVNTVRIISLRRRNFPGYTGLLGKTFARVTRRAVGHHHLSP